MGRSKLFYILVIIGLLVTVSGLLMMRSANQSLYYPGEIVGWVGVAVVIIARIFFSRRKQQPKPPAPKDNLKIS